MRPRVSEEILRTAAAGIRAVGGKDTALDEFLDSVPAHIRRSVSHLLFCYFRYRVFIDGEVEALVAKMPKPPIASLLLAATTQLRFQSALAPESAVNIAVDAAKRQGTGTLVNAVLRKIAAAKHTPPEDRKRLLPPELLAAWKKHLAPEALDEVLEALFTEPLFAFRCCRGAAPPADATALPGFGNFRFFAAPDPQELLNSEAFLRGDYYIQDPATSLALSLPDCTQVKSTLDLCAAPGGKTLMLAEKLRPGARIVAADRSEKRQERTRENCRIHKVNAEIIVAEPEALTGSFDLVLADVPCGNSGVFRRRPDAMWRFSKERLKELSALQSRILDAAAKLVSPGGQLLYSTCSIEPVEDDAAVAAFLDRNREFSLLKSRLLLPSLVNDGAFAALLFRCRS